MPVSDMLFCSLADVPTQRDLAVLESGPVTMTSLGPEPCGAAAGHSDVQRQQRQRGPALRHRRLRWPRLRRVRHAGHHRALRVRLLWHGGTPAPVLELDPQPVPQCPRLGCQFCLGGPISCHLAPPLWSAALLTPGYAVCTRMREHMGCRPLGLPRRCRIVRSPLPGSAQ